METISRRNALRLGLAALAAASLKPAWAGRVPVAAPRESLMPFAFNLYRQLPAGTDANIFFSPLSIVEAFGMLQAGARGQTADELARALGVEQQAMPGLIASINNILLGEDLPYKISLANALWIEKTYPVRVDYQTLLQTKYSAAAENCDFAGNPAAERRRINDWVEQQTARKIKDLMPEGSINPLTRLVLTNAIYFNAEWATMFEKSATHEGDFKLDSGTAVTSSLMYHEFRGLGYFEDEHIQAIDLPYKGNTASMLIILPRGGVVTELEKSLGHARIDAIIKALQGQLVQVTLPKFKLETSYGLIPPLKAMGVASAFSDKQADFTGIADSARSDGLHVTAAVHKAFVDVNEERTEAAGATGIAVGVRSMPMNPPRVFRADHPFVFLIRDRRSNEALFMGRVAKPA